VFIVDELLIEVSKVAMLDMADQATCSLSEALNAPYQPMNLAVFRGPEGKLMADRARADRRLTFCGRDFRVVADVSAQLECEDALVVEAA
jgi:hypothetical protein